MILQLALTLSVALQFGAFFITISLIPRTKYNSSWIMISIGFLLMALRRLWELIDIFSSNQSVKETFIESWIAVLISLLMFFGAFYIRKIFELQGRLDKFRKENEAKVLFAIIKTEEKERHRFAKELHDGLGPILSSIKMTLSAIDKTIEDPTNQQILEKTDHAIDEAILATKEISNNLSPHVLEHFGLEKAIKTFTNNIVIPDEMEIIISSNLNGKRYNYNIEVVLYRIIGELVSNTLKHAKASMIEISLYNYPRKLELFYSDNGIGFNIENQEYTGMGLSNIQSRVKSLDGEIVIKSKDSCFLKIAIPVNN